MSGRMAELVETDRFQGDRWQAQYYHMDMNDLVGTVDLTTQHSK